MHKIPTIFPQNRISAESPTEQLCFFEVCSNFKDSSVPVTRELLCGNFRVRGDTLGIRLTCEHGSLRRFTMSAAALTFVLSFLVAVSLVIAANIRIHSMCGDVNQRLPKNAQISLWDRSKMYEVLRLHAQMYPGSPKRWQMWTLAVTGFAFLFGGFFASLAFPR